MALFESQRDFWRKFCEVGLGVVIALFIAHMTAKDERSVIDDVLVGLLTTVAIAFLWEPIDQKRAVHDLTERLRTLTARVHEMKAGIDSVNGEAADQLDRYSLALRFTNKNLGRDEMPNAWERMLWSMRGNFDATSFIRPADYSKAYPDHGVAIQELKVKVTKARVRRIFILEDERELALMQAHMARQAAAQIEVSYVLQQDCATLISIFLPMKPWTSAYLMIRSRYFSGYSMIARLLAAGSSSTMISTKNIESCSTIFASVLMSGDPPGTLPPSFCA